MPKIYLEYCRKKSDFFHVFFSFTSFHRDGKTEKKGNFKVMSHPQPRISEKKNRTRSLQFRAV